MTAKLADIRMSFGGRNRAPVSVAVIVTSDSRLSARRVATEILNAMTIENRFGECVVDKEMQAVGAHQYQFRVTISPRAGAER